MTRKKWLFMMSLIVMMFLAACSESKPTINETDSNSGDETNVNDGNEQNNENENSNSNNNTVEKYDELFDDDPTITELVNKTHELSADYAPEDLITIRVPTVLENPEINQLRKVAADALEEMFTAAKEEGVYLYARSGYRSYQTQVNLFDSYAERNGIEAANTYSAKPGQSEHQTGLVIDVTSESVDLQLSEQFGETKEGIWVKDNAHNYGFIIRYPEGKEAITGYIYEPWHLRYLGVDLATAVYESNLTYEEFLEERN